MNYEKHEMEVVQYVENIYVVASGDGTIDYSHSDEDVTLDD